MGLLKKNLQMQHAISCQFRLNTLHDWYDDCRETRQVAGEGGCATVRTRAGQCCLPLLAVILQQKVPDALSNLCPAHTQSQQSLVTSTEHYLEILFNRLCQ